MKKVIITIILSIVSITGIGGFKIANNQSKENSINNVPEIQNEIATDENLINEEIVIPLQDEENKTSIDEVTPPSEPVQTNSENEKVEVPEKTETKKSTTSNSGASGKNNTSSSQSAKAKASTTSSSTTNKSTSSSSTTNKSTSTQTSTSSNTKTSTIPTTSTPKAQAVWCFEGGNKHMAGSDAYEHGYYSTWQQAWEALTNYMRDFSSGNYYVDQCACGKYYYYCKPD